MSYYECVQVSGLQEDIISGLLPLFNERTGTHLLLYLNNSLN